MARVRSPPRRDKSRSLDKSGTYNAPTKMCRGERGLPLPSLDACRGLHTGLYDVDKVCIVDMFLVVGQGDETAIGHLQLLGGEP